MAKREVNWDWWWEQVLAGIIPECVYRMARIREYYRRRVSE